ncbi:glycosyltransferase [Synechococcus sp. RS9916]|uniref:glycosyltransferase n=1 Tax=Synechococcus sp. RS9916 TaxID=221359 RepID=UPI0000E53399|nr:glycosyltransferase [Synechococcus sp. RS9916]EAU75517.1 Glycosyl transferase, group 1 [Synechococcus sp. RS9916]
MTLRRLLVFAPTRRAASETFVRANLAGLPFEVQAYFGDERPWNQPARLAYGLAVVLSKACTRLGLLRLAGWPAAVVARGLIARHRPDLVLAEFGFHAVRVMEVAPVMAVPLVVHFRGSDLSAQCKLGVLRGRYRRLMGLAAGLICKSKPMAQTLQTLGAPADRILISASGANAQLFHGSAPAAAPPVCLAVGRFVAKKGPLQTIRAFAAQPQGQLWMVGEGPLLAEAKALAEDLDLGERIRFLGVCSQVEVAALMRQVRVFVQHSLVAADGDSEGNPVAVMEAQLSGLPVVATRHAGIPEVVIDGQTGLLVAEGDVQGMAAAMERLLQDPALCSRFGAAGRCHVEQGFTLDKHLADLSRFLIQTHAQAVKGA